MLFVLYIPELPSPRAQSIQVVSAAHALARRGWTVRLCYRRGTAGGTPADPLSWYGLGPVDGLELVALPGSRTLASGVFRAEIVRHARRGGVFLARSKRYARFAMRIAPRAPVVIEAHEVDSLQHGSEHAELERFVLRRAAALVTNCEGVEWGLSMVHRLPALRRVVHNAWLPAEPSTVEGRGIALAGSRTPGKDVATVQAARIPGLFWYAGRTPPGDLVRTLRRHRTLLLPLGRGWFGEQLTSPLKAFAYLASGVPFVGADTPALHRVAPGAFEPYTPGDVGSLRAAIDRLHHDEAARQRCRAAMRPRTWDQRAAEIDEVLSAVR